MSLSDYDTPTVIAPFMDEYSMAVLDEAVAALGNLRMRFTWLGDGVAGCHLLASLDAEIRAGFVRNIALALDQDYSWSDITIAMGMDEELCRSIYENDAEECRANERRWLLTNGD